MANNDEESQTDEAQENEDISDTPDELVEGDEPVGGPAENTEAIGDSDMANTPTSGEAPQDIENERNADAIEGATSPATEPDVPPTENTDQERDADDAIDRDTGAVDEEDLEEE